ncbi:MAG TPA: bifunctional diaminohydroxyphosphoribosylaminopyrimidine deaminase/5-amino-6-(5-phosphoribosylamino)uracil reductase RibD [Gemmatimonadaceae bacterium]|nr:bifunctional diaminohydroxyphosphoribosylaminopyrimidine deaminase/5-amino-6-(5-phosphoribosylamino)uracil reductase RibD [Gemmatimonadaceae bacterium]
MRIALRLAERGWGQTAPNPMVGAVVFAGEEKVGEGFHSAFGAPHAEVLALRAAGERSRGGALYVNLEPCNHHGRNPPCTDAIIAAGITRVVAAVRDPNTIASGGAERLRSAGIDVEFGVLEAEARELNAVFLNRVTSSRPWVTLKLALSIDGAIAGAARRRWWLTNERSRKIVQRMRANSDAIAVGVETAIADDPQLTARTDPAPRVPPVRLVFDRSARLPAASFLARSARDIPTVLVTTSTTILPRDLADAGVEVVPADNLGSALQQLWHRGIASILVEGGAGLAASFLAGDHVDRLVIFRAPVVLGGGALGAFSGIAPLEAEEAPRFDLLDVQRLDDDVMTVYATRKR